MISLSKKPAVRKSLQDIVALDFGASGLKVLHCKRLNEVTTVVAADILSIVELELGAEQPKPTNLNLAKPLMSNYAALTYTGERSLIRVINTPGDEADPAEMEKTLREHIGLDNSYRVAHLAPNGTKGKENRVLAVAIPESDVKAVLAQVGIAAPAPYSFELSGLAALNGCLMGPAQHADTEAICIIDCGAHVSVMAIFNKGQLVLARKLEVGGQAVKSHIQKQFGVDGDMAQSILTQGAFDISSSIRMVIDPFVRQLTISRDYVERQENCRITSLYMSGGMCLNAQWVKEIEKASGLPVRMWNPFEGIAVAPGAIPERLQGHECRFASAMGAARGAMQST